MGISLLCKDNKAYARVDQKKNFAKVDSRQLDSRYDAWKCVETDYTPAYKYANAGFTSFSFYRIAFENSTAYLVTDDFLYSDSQTIQLDDKTVNNQIKAGHGGDCYSWNNCKENKKGEFSIDLTGTKLAFDPSVQWKYSGWPAHLTMVSSIEVFEHFILLSTTIFEPTKRHQPNVGDGVVAVGQIRLIRFL